MVSGTPIAGKIDSLHGELNFLQVGIIVHGACAVRTLHRTHVLGFCCFRVVSVCMKKVCDKYLFVHL